MTQISNLQHARQTFYADLRKGNLAPLWEVLHALVKPEPRSRMQPAAWDYGAVRSELMRAGELISAAEAERRVLILENPAAPGESKINDMIYAGLQLVLPGEIAPCHRHAQSALRFVMEGEGGYTAVDGEKAMMAPFDLILTPAGAWHDHANPAAAPMIWLDGLDIPIVSAFEASYAERLGGDQAQHPETRPPGATQSLYAANMAPVVGDGARSSNPLFHYPFKTWRGALLDAARHHDGGGVFTMEFLSPATGGAVTPTLSAFAHLVRAGEATRPRRTTESAVYVVLEGAGRMHVGEKTFDLAPRTIVSNPAWAAQHFHAQSDLILFSFSDRAAQQRLQIWREGEA